MFRRKRYSAEFKIQAVQLLKERLASGIAMKRVGEELDIRPDDLRSWAIEVDRAPLGTPAEKIFPGFGKRRSYTRLQTKPPEEIGPESTEQELKRLRRENERLRQERDFLKKSGGVLREGVAVKYAFIARQRGDHPVRLMCRWLDVSPAGFYASLKRGPSKRSKSNARLKLEIRAIHAANRRRYGAIKVHHELESQGMRCGHNRVARLMREEGLRSKRPKPFRVTTQSAHRKPVAENHLDRKFGLSFQRGINRVWVADISYLPTREGWLYLSTVIDLASRRVVGWCAEPRLDHSVALRALTMALDDRAPSRGELLHHSDRGVQYASEIYQSTLAANGITSSMSRKGNCWDNAVAESFFATLKIELVADANWESRSQARREVAEYINWYNYRRCHATLGYLSPVEYELQRLSARNAA
ncbi:MAG: IS3 family transposase [Gemmatimonadaceae bacterium]|nr:IS3 family transposase [Actinomycetota bacterium]